MSYVIGRRDGRFEIRESVHTPAGPRARTLATFTTLTDQVLAHAEGRATRRFDRDLVIERALARGARYEPPKPALLARELVRAMAAGERLPPALAAALRHQLLTDDDTVPDSIPPLIDWLGASSADRGEALRQLLRMTDRIPVRHRRRQKRFPHLRSQPV